ncbi:MAG: hypothetical protein ACRDD7_08470 [Peptostreptococcaceae bacterium]
MSIRINNTIFHFSQATTLQDAQQKANSIIDALAMVRNPFDFMTIDVNKNGCWIVK